MDEGAGPVRVRPHRTQRNQGTIGRQEPQPEPLTGACLADFVPRDGGLERKGPARTRTSAARAAPQPSAAPTSAASVRT